MAIFGVLASHSRLGLFEAGWIGVDVFFVLSGFLITTMLLREWDATGRIELGSFMIRRAFRLLPALGLLLVVLSVWAIVARSSLPGTARETILGIPAAALYVAAWMAAFGGDSLGALQHTWSLSVEEHFYVVWPFVLLLSLRWRRPTIVVAGTLWLLAIAWRLMIVAGGGDWYRVYSGPDTRAEQLLVGCLLAAVLARHRHRWVDRPGAGRVGTAAAVALLVIANLPLLFTSVHLWFGLTATALLSAVVVASVHLQPSAPLAHMLSRSPMVWVGRRSYGIYLWYWPVFLAFKESHIAKGWNRFAVEVPIIVVLAALSHRALEQPLQATGRRLAARRAAAAVPWPGAR